MIKLTNPRAVKSFDSFIKEIKQSRYKAFGNYVNGTTRVLIRCPEGHEYKVTPNKFNGGHRCSRCIGHCPEHLKEAFVKEVKEFKYTLIGAYKNDSTKVEIKCGKGHEYKVTPYDFRQGYRCPRCCANRSVGERL